MERMQLPKCKGLWASAVRLGFVLAQNGTSYAQSQGFNHVWSVHLHVAARRTVAFSDFSLRQDVNRDSKPQETKNEL